MWVRGSPPQRTGARRTTFAATIRQTYKSDGGPNYPWSGMQRHDHRKDARPRHRKAPRRHEFRGLGRGPHGHELLWIPDRDHRQRDPAGGPEIVLQPPRRRPPPDVLGDGSPSGWPELADLLLGAERAGRRPHPRGRGSEPDGTVVQ